MTASSHTQIIHESETQRQHARFPLPARAFLNGTECTVRNLSSGGVSLGNIDGAFARGKQVSLDLKLPFDSFSFDLTLVAEVQYSNAEEKILGCRFVNLRPEQVSFLNHVLKAFIGGDVVSAGSLLNVASRNNFTKVRAPANNNASGGIVRQLPALFLVAVIGVLIAAFIGGNLYNSLFVVKAQDAAVMGPTVAVRVPTGGVYRARIDDGLVVVQPNQVLGTVTPSEGAQPVTVQSPCRCYVTRTAVASGEMVMPGQQVMSLMPIDAKPWIVAEIDPSEGKKLGTETQADITIFGTRTNYTGHVASLESPLADASGGASGRPAVMKIVLDQKLPVDFVNRLAAVSFAIH